MKVAISSGHGLHIRGASGILDEVNEARRVVPQVAEYLRNVGVSVVTFNDDTSTDQSTNLNTIVNWHNKQDRELDVSVHFNAYEDTSKPMGTECLYVTQEDLAAEVAAHVSKASGLPNRGPKKRTDLFFLNKTNKPSILIEVCFVDSSADAELYRSHFGNICAAISETLSGVAQPPESIPPPEPEPEPIPEPSPGTFSVKGKVSHFGGPDDTGVSCTEGLALVSSVEQAPHLFLPYQPNGTIGLARRLNPNVHYLACRWDYTKTPKALLLEHRATVHSVKTGITLKAFPADWGPNEGTGRVADISPGLMEDLGITTDDTVEIVFPS